MGPISDTKMTKESLRKSDLEEKTIIGQEKLIDHINILLRQNKFPLSTIIYGPQGIGKNLAAHYIADKLLEKNHKYSPDFMEISEEDSSVGVEKIRSARQFFTQTPAQGKARILIIDNADNMTIQASNALLKLLEEPRSNSYLILIVHRLHNLLPTIISRCIKFKAEIPEKLDLEHLSKLLGIDTMDFRLAGFSIGQAKYFEEHQIANYYRDFLSIIKNLDKFEGDKIWAFAEKVNSYKGGDFWNIFIQLLTNFTIHAIRCKYNKGLCYPEWETEALKAISTKTLGGILKWYEDIKEKCIRADRAHLDKKQVILTLF